MERNLRPRVSGTAITCEFTDETQPLSRMRRLNVGRLLSPEQRQLSGAERSESLL